MSQVVLLDTDGTMITEVRDEAGALKGVWIKGRNVVGDMDEVYLSIEVYRAMLLVMERPFGVVASIKM